MVGEESLNLYDLEQHLLIPDFKEPRIHFAIVCASQSCPKLQLATYNAESLDQQLNASAQQFINDPTRNRFDRHHQIAYLSKIFEWFSEDFINHSGSGLSYVAQFVWDPDLANPLLHNAYTIEFFDYDWSLNGFPPLLQKKNFRRSVPNAFYPSFHLFHKTLFGTCNIQAPRETS